MVITKDEDKAAKVALMEILVYNGVFREGFYYVQRYITFYFGKFLRGEITANFTNDRLIFEIKFLRKNFLFLNSRN